MWTCISSPAERSAFSSAPSKLRYFTTNGSGGGRVPASAVRRRSKSTVWAKATGPPGGAGCGWAVLWLTRVRTRLSAARSVSAALNVKDCSYFMIRLRRERYMFVERVPYLHTVLVGPCAYIFLDQTDLKIFKKWLTRYCQVVPVTLRVQEC